MKRQNLNFHIDEYYLISLILSPRAKNCEFYDLYTYVNSVSSEIYDFLNGYGIYPTLMKHKSLNILQENLTKFFDTIILSDEFQIILEETNNFKNKCEIEWKANLDKTSKIINDLTGINFDIPIDVYVVHPCINQHGGARLPGNIVLLGFDSDYHDSITISLWHDILYKYLKSNDHIAQAVIELVTYGELRYRLNGIKYPPVIDGKQSLDEIRKSIYPTWIQYLKSDKKDIRAFIKESRHN